MLERIEGWGYLESKEASECAGGVLLIYLEGIPAKFSLTCVRPCRRLALFLLAPSGMPRIEHPGKDGQEIHCRTKSYDKHDQVRGFQ